MSLLHPILSLNGKRKDIFDLIFDDVEPFDDDKTSVAVILLGYDEDYLEQLLEEVKNAQNKLELVLSKEKDAHYKPSTNPHNGMNNVCF